MRQEKPKLAFSDEGLSPGSYLVGCVHVSWCEGTEEIS